MDINGNICGIKGFETTSYAGSSYTKEDGTVVTVDAPTKRPQPDLTDFAYLYPVNLFGSGICVKSCPTVADPFVSATVLVGAAGYTILPGSPPQSWGEDQLPTGVYIEGAANLNFGKGLDFPVVDTTELMGRCYMSAKAQDKILEMYNAGAAVPEDEKEEEEGTMTAFYADMWTAKDWVLGFGFAVSILVAFFYCYFLRIPGVLFVMVWGCIGAVFSMFAAMGAYCYNEATVTWVALNLESAGAYSDSEIQTMKIMGFVGFGAAAIWFLLMCFLRSRIQLALGVVKEAAKAVAAMPLIIFFPIIQCIGFIIFMILWMYYAVHLASMGDPTDCGYCSANVALSGCKAVGSTTTTGAETTCLLTSSNIWIRYTAFTYDDNQTNAAWFLLFCYFWTSQFIIALGQIVVAMAVATWYFTKDKSTIGNGNVIKAIKMSAWYHCGTAAFGSLIIAIIKMIRAWISYMQKQAKKSGSKAAQAVLCAIQVSERSERALMKTRIRATTKLTHLNLFSASCGAWRSA